MASEYLCYFTADTTHNIITVNIIPSTKLLFLFQSITSLLPDLDLTVELLDSGSLPLPPFDEDVNEKAGLTYASGGEILLGFFTVWVLLLVGTSG